MKKLCSKPVRVVLALCFISGAAGCATKSEETKTAVSNIQVYDRNGSQEVISAPDKLKKLAKVDLLQPQPYQKVVKVFEKNKAGVSCGVVATYHDNGMPWQYLETVGGRAHGEYREWFSSGQLRMQAQVIEGNGDVAPEAQTSWIFDKSSKVWDERGALIAQLFYEKGKLVHESTYFHANGTVAKVIPYTNGRIHGTVIQFNEEGSEIGSTEFVAGQKEGLSVFKGNEMVPEREEHYSKGLLLQGRYMDLEGKMLSEIVSGNGFKPVFSQGHLANEYEYRSGKPMGEVRTYRADGTLMNVYSEIDGLREGEEWCYFDEVDEKGRPKPSLYLNWKEDKIHGIVRTWYSNGTLESEKEMAENKKHGVLLAWYQDGSLMLVEHYEEDVLKEGKYLKKGEDIPTSRVLDGSGIATIFDAEGRFVRKVDYRKGQPVD